MDQIVNQILEIDSQSRTLLLSSQHDDDIFTFDDLKPNEWDYSLPTLTRGKRNTLVGSLKQFSEEFYKEMPIEIDMANLLFAGGCVSDILRKKTDIRDHDIFLYGLTPDQATQRLNQLIVDLSKSYESYLIKKQQEEVSKTDKKEKKKPIKVKFDFKYIRNKNCVSLIFDSDVYGRKKLVIQIILRIYKNKSQILHGFDLGSSAVGFDGKQVYFTTLSKFAYEYSCNIIDTTRRSTTYERRLEKYFNRDFDIIVPNFNINLIRNINSKYGILDVCELPYLVFSYSDVKGNKIVVHGGFLSFKRKDKDTSDVSMNPNHSDYQIEDLDEHNIFYINLQNLVMGKEDYYYYETTIKQALNCKPSLSRRKIIDYYDILRTRLRKDGNINLIMLKKYIKDCNNLLKLLIEKGENDDEFTSTLETVIQEEKKRVLLIADQLLKKTYPINWLTTNPATQLTSSFNPIIEDPHLWYGEYYTEIPTKLSSLMNDKEKETESTKDIDEQETDKDTHEIDKVKDVKEDEEVEQPEEPEEAEETEETEEAEEAEDE